MGPLRGDDAGTISFFVLGCVVALFALAGLTFDGGGKVRQAEHADAVAREAARAACEQVDRPTVMSGGAYVLNEAWAEAAGAAYVRSAGMRDYAFSQPKVDECRVTLTAEYRTQLLGLIGIHTMTVTGSGQAQFVYGVDSIGG